MSIKSWFSWSKKPEISPEAQQDFAPAIPSKEGAKKERAGRRELLYSAIRTVLSAAGLSTEKFKFKVLSLDPTGVNFIVMVEISGELMVSKPKLMEMETLIAKLSMEQHKIFVTAVYWRLSLLPISRHMPGPLELSSRKLPRNTPANTFDPVESEEVAAFRNALTRGQRLSVGEISAFAKRPASRNEPATASSPLSATQYGDLV